MRKNATVLPFGEDDVCAALTTSRPRLTGRHDVRVLIDHLATCPSLSSSPYATGTVSDEPPLVEPEPPTAEPFAPLPSGAAVSVVVLETDGRITAAALLPLGCSALTPIVFDTCIELKPSETGSVNIRDRGRITIPVGMRATLGLNRFDPQPQEVLLIVDHEKARLYPTSAIRLPIGGPHDTKGTR